MGAWGAGNFDNDSAIDYLGEIEEELVTRIEDILQDEDRCALDAEYNQQGGKNMALPQVMDATETTRVYEGTPEDILAVLQSNTFVGQRMQLIVSPQEDLSENLPDPPNTVRDEAHLKELLAEGIASPKREMTAQDWIDIDHAVEARLAARKQNA